LDQFHLICVSNAPSSNITLDNVIDVIKDVSISEDTPLLSADLTSLSFCRHFPDTRVKIPVAGISGMVNANYILSSSKTTILILNNDHDPATPLAWARYLRSLLPDSSVLAIRGGSGHTTPSIASLSLAQTISDFFTAGVVSLDNIYHNIDQVIFPPQPVKNPLAPVLNGTGYSEGEMRLLQATYDIVIAFAFTQTPGQRNL
jgi:hypothetical protein